MKYASMKKWLSLGSAGLVASSLLLFAPISQADTGAPPLDDPNSPNTTILQQILSEIQNFHQNVVESFSKLTTANLRYNDLIKNRNTYKITKQWITDDSKDDTENAAKDGLGLDAEGYYQAIAKGADAVNSAMANSGNPNSAKQFSASSIVDNVALTEGSQEMQQAESYITSLSGQNNPLRPPEKNMNTQKANSKISVQQYKAALGTFTAAQSAALNTLYKALAARTVQTGLGSDAGIPGKPNASPLEVQQYMVTQPFSSEWADKVLNDASPNDLQKQQLFMLAGIQNLLFENRMQMEQININLAALILQSQQSSTRERISLLRSQAVKSLR